jgi:hypothetical protein
MADDERADQRGDQRDAQVAQWLEVEPLDDVTRRRLVSTALRDSDAGESNGPARRSRAWQWLSAAAVLVVVVVVGLAVLTSGGGNDEQASLNDRATATPKAAAATVDVGDYGNLDDPANLAALRVALRSPSAASRSAAPSAAGDASDRQFGSAESAPTSLAGDTAALQLCGAVAPDGGTVVAQGTGTIAGRRATVVLVEAADGTRTLEAVLENPCEVRHLP